MSEEQQKTLPLKKRRIEQVSVSRLDFHVREFIITVVRKSRHFAHTLELAMPWNFSVGLYNICFFVAY